MLKIDDLKSGVRPDNELQFVWDVNQSRLEMDAETT